MISVGQIICKLWSENPSAAALTTSTFPAVRQSEVIQIAFFAVLVHHYFLRVLTNRKIVFRKGPVSRQPSLKMYSKSILIRCFNKRFNNENAMTSPVHYDEYKHVVYFIFVLIHFCFILVYINKLRISFKSSVLC